MTGDRKNLGEILLEQGIIDREALNHALQLQGRRLGEILIDENLASPIDVANALKQQARTPLKQTPVARLTLDARTVETVLRQLEAAEDSSQSGGARLTMIRHELESVLVCSTLPLLQRVERVARKTAEVLNKEVTPQITGDNLLIDRLLVDELADVALHLVRNAVDHGIELPNVRMAHGKPTSGNVFVKLACASTTLTLSVSDDGAGIDEEKVYNRAVERGLIQGKEREELNASDLYRILFTPGFSTADTVTSISGRGVGLDVVEATVLRLGGRVNITSQRGKGTTIDVILPLRYAELPVLTLRTDQHWIAVASNTIKSITSEAAWNGDAAAVFDSRSLYKSDRDPDLETVIAREKAASMIVETRNGSFWRFDEVTSPQNTLVRADARKLSPRGVIGSVRLESKTILFVELDLLGGT